jgi:hypothetical protein
VSVPRNARCPCGSGLKHKRCCAGRARDEAAQVRREERIGRDTEAWAFATFGDELRAAAEAAGRAGIEAHPQHDWILLHWLLLDRELSGGGTPAQRYAALPELSVSDREIAARVADARPGIHRVVACDPGHGLVLEDVVRGGRRRVCSATISRTAVVWDVLIARVMTNPDHASLWGPVAVFAPDEEDELVDELRQLSAREDPERAWRRCWRDLVTFRPRSRDWPAEVLTVEGDTLVGGHAAWEIVDDEAAFEQLDHPLEYVGEDERGAEVFEWLIPRTEALARRPLRGDGALYLEARLPEHPGMVTVATFRLYADWLVLSTYSERRLDLAIDLVARQLHGLGRLAERDVSPLEADRAPAPRPAMAHLDSVEVKMYLTEWLDTPLKCLAGLTPRAAATRAEHRGELERLVRGIENRAARTRARGEPWPEVDFVRHELNLGEHVQLAA